MGVPYQRADGSWLAPVELGVIEGKRQRKMISAKTKKEAMLRQREYYDQVREGIDPDKRAMPFVNYLDLWLRKEIEPKRRRSTWSNFSDVSNHFKADLGHYTLGQLTPEIFDDYFTAKRGEGYKTSTLHLWRTVIAGCLNYAVRFKHLRENPVKHVRVTLEVPTSYRVIYEDEQVRRLIRAAKHHRLGPLFILCLGTGLRKGEALALKWSDIDKERRMIEVCGTLSEWNGVRVVGAPKTQSSRRTIPLSAALLDVFEMQRKQQEFERKRAGERWKEGGYVFSTIWGRPLSARWVGEALREICVEAGLPPLRFHDLRHNFATHALDKGVAANVVKELLGHSGISITLDLYGHVLERQKAQAVEALPFFEEETNKEDKAA
jgi:integrase